MHTDINWSHHLEFAVLLIILIAGFRTLDEKIERQRERIDRVYEIFVDVQRDNDEKLYELIRNINK